MGPGSKDWGSVCWQTKSNTVLPVVTLLAGRLLPVAASCAPGNPGEPLTLRVIGYTLTHPSRRDVTSGALRVPGVHRVLQQSATVLAEMADVAGLGLVHTNDVQYLAPHALDRCRVLALYTIGEIPGASSNDVRSLSGCARARPTCWRSIPRQIHATVWTISVA